jgi:hypothetical protein
MDVLFKMCNNCMLWARSNSFKSQLNFYLMGIPIHANVGYQLLNKGNNKITELRTIL